MRFDLVVLKRVVIAGGWMTVSNVISPVIGYLDRFVIGYLISAVVVSYYVVPQELITKVWIIPMAITSVLFPVIVEKQVSDLESAVALTNRATRTIVIIVAPLLLIAGYFSFEILSIWISRDFADNGSFVFKIFCFGVFINCLAHAPLTFLQSAGKTSITAAIHFTEFIFYIPLVWFSTIRFGLQGAAIAWLARIFIDALLINYFFKKSSSTRCVAAA
jgi:O-antigen/teichoic acid export membrane protein